MNAASVAGGLKRIHRRWSTVAAQCANLLRLRQFPLLIQGHSRELCSGKQNTWSSWRLRGDLSLCRASDACCPLPTAAKRATGLLGATVGLPEHPAEGMRRRSDRRRESKKRLHSLIHTNKSPNPLPTRVPARVGLFLMQRRSSSRFAPLVLGRASHPK